MEKIYRDSVDVQVTFTSNMKWATAISGASNSQEQIPEINDTKVQTPESLAIEKPFVVGLSRMIKRLLRSVARFFYRVSVPTLWPLAFRIRRYFVDSLQQDLQRSHAEIQAIKETLQNEKNWLQSRLEQIEQYGYTSVRRVAVGCGPDEVLIRSEVGYILCSPRDHAILACLLDTGELERGIRLLIQRFLKPGDVFIDVGANLGLHTLAAAKAMHGWGRIVAFEPFESTHRLLEKSVWMNGFSSIVEIHQTAVSNQSGHQQLFLGAISGHHSLFPLSPPPGTDTQSVEVPLVKLDDVMASTTDINLIKIDVEGAELEVLEGAKSLIENNQEIALIVKFSPFHLFRTGHSASNWLLNFERLGLIYKAINVETGQLEKWSIEQLEAVESINLLFARPNAFAWRKAKTA